MPKKKSPATAGSTRLKTDKLKATSQIPQVKDVVKNICDSKRIISYTSCSYKLGRSIVESPRIIFDRKKANKQLRDENIRIEEQRGRPELALCLEKGTDLNLTVFQIRERLRRKNAKK